MKLSDHFTLEEMIATQHRNINNMPPYEVIWQIIQTATALEGVRTLLGAPIAISSGYRSPELNKAVGGSLTSQHSLGQAVDFTCEAFGNPDAIVKKIMKSDIKFDQLIREYDRWVHIGFSDRNRKQVLIIDKKGTRNYK